MIFAPNFAGVNARLMPEIRNHSEFVPSPFNNNCEITRRNVFLLQPIDRLKGDGEIMIRIIPRFQKSETTLVDNLLHNFELVNLISQPRADNSWKMFWVTMNQFVAKAVESVNRHTISPAADNFHQPFAHRMNTGIGKSERENTVWTSVGETQNVGDAES